MRLRQGNVVEEYYDEAGVLVESFVLGDATSLTLLAMTFWTPLLAMTCLWHVR
jgi:hypothetical protein